MLIIFMLINLWLNFEPLELQSSLKVYGMANSIGFTLYWRHFGLKLKDEY